MRFFPIAIFFFSRGQANHRMTYVQDKIFLRVSFIYYFEMLLLLMLAERV